MTVGKVAIAPPAVLSRRGRVPVLGFLVLAGLASGLYAYDLRAANGFRFAYPWALAALPLGIALLTVFAVRRRPAGAAVLRHARAADLARVPRGWWSRLADLPVLLRALGILLLGLAAARPQSALVDDRIELSGIDIVVVLDLSGSMAEADLVPNRLEAAKVVIRDFVKRRRSDRLGLVLFGHDAYTYVPLTLDHGTYLRMLADLQLGIIDGKGTAIGNGIGVGLNRLRKSDARSKVLILLTDGDNNAGNISPLEAAAIAKKLGIKIHTILAGAGTVEGADQNAPRGARYPVNPQLLEQIATETGGTPYLATDSAALARRFEDILEDLEKSTISDRGVLYAELYPRFLWPAFALLLLELALRLTRFRRLP